MIGRTALQHETAITIAAFDKAFFIDFEPDSRMAKRIAAGNIAGPVATHAGFGDTDGFRSIMLFHRGNAFTYLTRRSQAMEREALLEE